jgi:hypothetical protein
VKHIATIPVIKTMTIELTQQEAQQLIGLLDLATKSGGLQVAQAALPLAIKVQAALDAETKEAQ